jgi:transposase
MLEGEIHRQLRGHRDYQAIQAINGIGPTIAAISVAEIGDVARFRARLHRPLGSHPVVRSVAPPERRRGPGTTTTPYLC